MDPAAVELLPQPLEEGIAKQAAVQSIARNVQIAHKAEQISTEETLFQYFRISQPEEESEIASARLKLSDCSFCDFSAIFHFVEKKI